MKLGTLIGKGLLLNNWVPFSIFKEFEVAAIELFSQSNFVSDNNKLCVRSCIVLKMKWWR